MLKALCRDISIAICALWTRPHLLQKTRNLILKEKRFLYQALDEMGIGYIPTVANFILIDLEKDALTIFKKMLKQAAEELKGQPDMAAAMQMCLGIYKSPYFSKFVRSKYGKSPSALTGAESKAAFTEFTASQIL